MTRIPSIRRNGLIGLAAAGAVLLSAATASAAPPAPRISTQGGSVDVRPDGWSPPVIGPDGRTGNIDYSNPLPPGFDGMTRMQILQMASFDGPVPDVLHQYGVGLEAGNPKSNSSFADAMASLPIRCEGAPTVGPRGFSSNNPWPEGIVLFDWPDEIKDLFADPPDEPSEEEIIKLRVIPNSLAVMLYVEIVTCERILFVGYDESVHAPRGYVLVDANGPNPCSNTAAVGYQGVVDQHYSVCQWGAFGTVLHEFGHTMGLFHEQERPDRDPYVDVNIQHVLPGFVGQFTINNSATMYGDYDLCSVMHYPRRAFTSNGLPTIEVRAENLIDLHTGELCTIDPDTGYPIATDPVTGDLLVDADDNFIINPELEDTVPVNLYPLSPGFCPDQNPVSQPTCGYDTGTGNILSNGDLFGLYDFYGEPGEPFPWSPNGDPNCPADVNQDGIQNGADIIAFMALINTQDPFADLNGDGLWNGEDLTAFLNIWTPGYCFDPDGPPLPPGINPINPGG